MSPSGTSWGARAAFRLRALVRSPWAGPAGRVLLAALALAVLSAIGGSALAGASATAGSTGPPDAQASAVVGATAPTPAATVLAETVIAIPQSDAGATAPAATATANSAGKATENAPVGLNSAALDDLRRLPGIGPKKAAAILALRAKLGRFRRAEELMRVKGIGRKTFAKLRPLVKVDEPPAS